MNDGAQREMSLEEFCNKLPPFHRVNKELSTLKIRLEELEKILNQITQSTAYQQCQEAERIAENMREKQMTEHLFFDHIREAILILKKSGKWEFPCLKNDFKCEVGWATMSCSEKNGQINTSCMDKPENCTYFPK